MIEEPLITDIFWEIHDAFGDNEGGDYMLHSEKLIIPEGESFYSVMNKLKLFLVKFWESDEEECTIVTHGIIIKLLSLMFLQAPLEKFRSMNIFNCGVSKIQ